MINKILLIILAFTFIYCQNGVYTQGERLYKTYCSNCHGEDGNGLKNLYPPLNNSDFLAKNQDLVACIIRYGLEDEITVNGKSYMMPMAGLDMLTDVDITNLINYINTAWDNEIEEITIQRVKANLEECEE
jgi:mono/diheme cytochrome c family protein